MALHHTPVEPDRLSPPVLKALGGPPALKLMAARGLAPMPRPGDLATVLYQLARDADPAVQQAARKTAIELPDNLLKGAVSDPSVDRRVLDYFAALVMRKPALVEPLILNAATADETIAELAGALGEREIDLISGNEQRLLRHPAIIGAMYMNRHARMSTVDRAVEIAVRNQVKVPGIPAWDEVVAAVLGTGKREPAAAAEQDKLFAELAAKAAEDPAAFRAAPPPADAAEVDDDGEVAADEAELAVAPDVAVPLGKMNIAAKVRMAMIGNQFVRGQLVRDPNRMVASAAIKSPAVNELEARKYAGNHALCEEVISHIASRRDWTKLYSVKLALVQNPKTPLSASMRLMGFLREKDVRMVARSKGIPSAVSAQARKLVAQRDARNGQKR